MEDQNHRGPWTYPDESVAVALGTGLGRICTGIGWLGVRFWMGLMDFVASTKHIIVRKENYRIEALPRRTMIQYGTTNFLPDNPQITFPRSYSRQGPMRRSLR